jgi:hypothetical protein
MGLLIETRLEAAGSNIQHEARWAMGMISKYLGFTILAAGSLALTACNGGGSSSSGTGQLSLAVTDAPVDGAVEVVVRFTRVELQPRDGQRISIEFDTVQEIDLLSYQGEDVHWLFEDTAVPAGEYSWIRLYVERDGTAGNPPASVFGTTSYLKMADGSEYKLAIPSGLQTGLKLQGGFSVQADRLNAYVIDFDLRRALVQPSAQHWQDYYFLKPALRMVRLEDVGHLRGTIHDQVFVADPACLNNGAVYLYQGHGQTPTDVHDDAGPVTTALIEYDGVADEYRYRIGHLPAGPYTVALTCEAHRDDPEQSNTLTFFAPAANVAIQADVTTVQDLP